MDGLVGDVGVWSGSGEDVGNSSGWACEYVVSDGSYDDDGSAACFGYSAVVLVSYGWAALACAADSESHESYSWAGV